MKLILFVPLLFFACAEKSDAEASEPRVSEVIPNTLEQLRNDMLLPHEGVPNGTEGMDWGRRPRVGYGNEPPPGWNAMITWGQVYAPTTGNPATNTRFELKDMRTYYLSKSTGEWIEWQRSSKIGGANYAEDFQNDRNIPADLRKTDLGYSAGLREGYNFHFWIDEGRVAIDPADIAGVWSAIDGRLIIDDADRPDDLGKARMMLSAGSDYWKALDSEWDQWTTNGDIGIGRFRYLTKDWQTYNMHTLSEAQLRENPPPF